MVQLVIHVGVSNLNYRFPTVTDMLPIEMYRFRNPVIPISFFRLAFPFPFPHKKYGNGSGQRVFPTVFIPTPEAPVHSGVLERVDNVKRGKGRPKLTWDESVKRDLKDWNISKESFG